MEIKWNDIESKWREKWNENKDFETNPNEKPKKFITVAYPYPNSPQHIGHGRTYTLADVHARFYRMQGYNVLFPMGFHYTGTPILGMAKRVESGDKEILDGLRNIYHVPEEDIKTFVEPIKIADYFHEEIKAGMIEMGYSIDWRREFTTIVPAYQKFIEWQINNLREKNLIIQGSHPVGWCPRDQNPVSQHDTLGDVEPDFTEYILIKFKFDDYIIPTATLRPETIFGVTNLWVNPKTIYKKITVNGEKWIVSNECAHKLEFLDKEIIYDGEIAGSDLVGNKVVIPYRNESIFMLEASFVESGTGTGLVMSVPAHAPFDYQALVDFKKDQPLGSEFQIIKPISIISTEGYGEYSAKEACEKFEIKNQDDPKLEEATTEIYGKEFYGGVLKENCEQFAGKKVSEAKDIIKEWLAEKKYSEILLELTNTPVRCRCGTECVVKVLSNQWFLNYGDKDWKAKATKCFDSMSILP
ncbi:MAG: leucine--tRNA ligase, partial [Nitrosopumilus sp.]|nr:leucine--tRNA ligase [Nitrosopumilus sp.]